MPFARTAFITERPRLPHRGSCKLFHFSFEFTQTIFLVMQECQSLSTLIKFVRGILWIGMYMDIKMKINPQTLSN